MVIENQQVTAIVNRRALVCGNDFAAGKVAFAVQIGSYDSKRRAAFAGCIYIFRKLRCPYTLRNDNQIARKRFAYGYIFVAAMDGEINKLQGAFARNPALRKSTVELLGATRVVGYECRAHKNLSDNRIYERRMYSVTAEITCTLYAVAQA